MQRGSQLKPIVGDMHNINYFRRGPSVTEMKRNAQRRHRRRIKQNLGRFDEASFDDQPYDGLDAWDVW